MDELQISGKRFISSRRIARDNSYTSDYIGQLIRGGKVIGQKVGRAWYVDAVSFETFLGEERTPEKLPEPVVEIKKLEDKTLEPIIVAQKKEEAHHVPLHIIKTEAPAGLQYYQDDRPSLPEIRDIRSEKNDPWAGYPTEETRNVLNNVFTPHAERRFRPAHIFGLAFLGIMVFIFSAVASNIVSLNLSIDADNTASAYYSLHW